MKKIISLIVLLIFFIYNNLSQCTPATATVVVTEPGCDGNSGQIEVTASGGTGPYEYGIGGWSTQTSNVFTGLSAGSYNVRIITADNCESWVNGVVLSYTPMEFSSSVVKQTCYDYVAGSININPTRGTSPYTYSGDGGITYNSINFFQQLDVGTYSYKVKDAKGCIEDVSFNITKSHIDPSVTTTSVQCSGILGTAAITFGGTDNYTFSIDNNASVQSGSGNYSYTGLNSGNYLLQCNDINGCNESINFTIGDENISSSITGVVHETCNDNNGALEISTTNGVGPYQYSIDEGLTFVATNQFLNLNEGSYYTKVIDSRGCESVDTVVITNTGGIEASISEDTTICNGDIATLNVNAIGETLSYNWDNGLSNNPTNSVAPNSTTQYNVSVNDAYGCVENLNVTVTVNEYPNIYTSTNNVDLCMGDSILINAYGASTYIWSNGDTTSSSIINTPFGEDSVYIYGYNGMCSSVLSIPIDVHSIDAHITDTQHICIGSSTTLYVNTTTPVTYQWNNGGGTSSNYTVSPNTDTYYKVILTDTYGCKDTLETKVIIDEDVNITVSPTYVEACLGEEFTLEVNGATGYLWSSGETTSVINKTALANEVVTVTGINGECNNSIDIPITVLPSPSIEIEANASSINTGDGIQFGVGNSNASSYIWNFGDGNTANYSVPYHVFNFPGAYFVTLKGNIGNCNNTDTLLIYVGTVDVDKKLDYNINIFPNPVINNLKINVQEDINYNIKILNSDGKLIDVYYNKIGNTNVDMNNYSSGLYFVNIITEKHNYIEIIQKQ